MNILITGSAGFIGSQLVNKFKNEDIEILGIDNINDYYDPELKYARLENAGISKAGIKDNIIVKSKIYKNYSFIKTDLTNKDAINKLFKDYSFDYVCNLAAQVSVRYSLKHPEPYINSNIIGFLNLLEACRYNEIKHFVYASSSSVYGLNEKMPFKVSDNVDHPISLYAASKKSNELMAHTYSHLFGMPTTGLRFFTVYGPWGRPDMAYSLFADAIMKGQPIKIFNHGKMKRDFTYVDDIVKAVKMVIEKPAVSNNSWSAMNPDPSDSSAPYKLYNIGNNRPVQLMDFIKELEISLGKQAIKEYLPLQAGDVPDTYADVSGLISDFDYKPNTSLKEGIKQFAEWYKNFYKI